MHKIKYGVYYNKPYTRIPTEWLGFLKIAKEHIPVEISVASSTDTSNKQYLYLSIENGKEMAYTHSNAACGVYVREYGIYYPRTEINSRKQRVFFPHRLNNRERRDAQQLLDILIS